MNVCSSCKKQVEEWNEKCRHCGFTLELVPDARRKARYLRSPSLGALLWTQGWTFGARLYFLFLLSFIPIVGLIVLFVCVVWGRRLSWKYGGWSDWGTFVSRMRLWDAMAIAWVVLLMSIYAYWRFV